MAEGGEISAINSVRNKNVAKNGDLFGDDEINGYICSG